MPATGYDQVAKTHVGCRRKLNEDAVLACPERKLWAVADGMGGHDAGEVASAMVVEALWRSPSDASGGANADGVLAALDEVNERLVEMGRTGFDSRTIGSTVVGLVGNGDAFTCFWAGDSRAYHVRQGEITQLTKDHSLVQDLVDAGMIEPEEAEGHPNANVITRAVGAAPEVIIDVVGGDVRPGDLFMIASDGLTRKVQADEIADALAAPMAEAADGLINKVLDRGAPDNVTLVVVRAT